MVSSVKKAFIAAANNSLFLGELDKLQSLFPKGQKPLEEIDGIGCIDYSGNIIDLVLSSDEESLLVATDDGKLQVIDTVSIKEKSQITVLYESSNVNYQRAIARPCVGGSWTVLSTEGKAFQLVSGNQCLIDLAETKKFASLSWHPSGLYLLAGEIGSSDLSLLDFSGHSLARIPLPDDLAEGGIPTYSAWLNNKTFLVMVRDAEDEYFFETLICDLSDSSDLWKRKDEDLCYASLSLKNSRNQTWFSETLDKWSHEPFFLMAFSQSTEVGLVPIKNPDVDYDEDFHQCTIPVTVDDPEEYGPVGIGLDLTDNRGVDSDGKYDPEGAPQPVIWILDSQVKLHGYHLSCSDAAEDLNAELNRRSSLVEDAKAVRLAIAGQLKNNAPESTVTLAEKSISQEIADSIPTVIRSGSNFSWTDKSLVKETVLDELFLALESLTAQQAEPNDNATEDAVNNETETHSGSVLSLKSDISDHAESNIDPSVVADSVNSEEEAGAPEESVTNIPESDAETDDTALETALHEHTASFAGDGDCAENLKDNIESGNLHENSSNSTEEASENVTNEESEQPAEEVVSEIDAPIVKPTDESNPVESNETQKGVTESFEHVSAKDSSAAGSLSASKFAPQQQTTQDSTQGTAGSGKGQGFGFHNLNNKEGESSLKQNPFAGASQQNVFSTEISKLREDIDSTKILDDSKKNAITVDASEPEGALSAADNQISQSEATHSYPEKISEYGAKESPSGSTAQPDVLQSSGDSFTATNSPGKGSFLQPGKLNSGRFGQAFGGSTTSSMPFSSSLGSAGFGFAASNSSKPFSFGNSPSSGTKLFEPSNSNSGGFSAFADGNITPAKQENEKPTNSMFSSATTSSLNDNSPATDKTDSNGEKKQSNWGLFSGNGSFKSSVVNDEIDRELTSEEESEVSDADEYDENDMEEAYSFLGVKSNKAFDQQIKALSLGEGSENNETDNLETLQKLDKSSTPSQETKKEVKESHQNENEGELEEFESELEEPFEIAEFVEFDWTSESRSDPNGNFFGVFNNYLEDCSGIDEIILQAFEDTVTVHSNFSILNGMIAGQKDRGAPPELSDLAKSDSWRLSDNSAISDITEQLKAKIEAIKENQDEALKNVEEATASTGTLMLHTTQIEDLLKNLRKEVSSRTLALRSMPLQAMKMKRKVDANFLDVSEQLNKVDSELNVLRLDLARRYKSSKLTEEGVKNSITTLSRYGKKIIKQASAVVSQYESALDTSITFPDESFKDESALETLREETQDRLAFLARKGRRKVRVNLGSALRQRPSSSILNNNPKVETSSPFAVYENV